MSAPTLNSNLSLLVIPGFSLVGKMIDSRPDWRAVDFCALQSDSAGIRPITCSRASRQGAGGLTGWGGGVGQPVPAQVVLQHPLNLPFFLQAAGYSSLRRREAATQITGNTIRSGG